MSQVDFDSDADILTAVTAAGPAAAAAGAVLQIQLPDGHILGYVEHPFMGKKGDEIQEALDSVRATWKMRQQMQEAEGRQRARQAALADASQRDNQDAPLPLSDAELLLAAQAKPRRAPTIPDANARVAALRDTMPAPARGTYQETTDESDDDPVKNLEKKVEDAKRRMKTAERDAEEANERFEKAQATYRKWRKALDAALRSQEEDDAADE